MKLTLDQEISNHLLLNSVGLEEYRKSVAGPQCGEHRCKITECFDKHHTPIRRISLPCCGALILRPEKMTASVECPDCGTKWNLATENNSKGWTAIRIPQ